jgi:hypothetical protein
MKTPFLISSIAALCLMINVNESGHLPTAENIVDSDLIFSTATPGKVCVDPDEKVQPTEIKVVAEPSAALIPENYNYLKFNINDYSGNTDVSSFDDTDLPGNDYGYLRFDVDNYIDPIADSRQNIELPAEDYSYLKFDVNVYIISDQENGSDSEQPIVEAQF